MQKENLSTYYPREIPPSVVEEFGGKLMPADSIRGLEEPAMIFTQEWTDDRCVLYSALHWRATAKSADSVFGPNFTARLKTEIKFSDRGGTDLILLACLIAKVSPNREVLFWPYTIRDKPKQKNTNRPKSIQPRSPSEPHQLQLKLDKPGARLKEPNEPLASATHEFNRIDNTRFLTKCRPSMEQGEHEFNLGLLLKKYDLIISINYLELLTGLRTVSELYDKVFNDQNRRVSQATSFNHVMMVTDYNPSTKMLTVIDSYPQTENLDPHYKGHRQGHSWQLPLSVVHQAVNKMLLIKQEPSEQRVKHKIKTRGIEYVRHILEQKGTNHLTEITSNLTNASRRIKEKLRSSDVPEWLREILNLYRELYGLRGINLSTPISGRNLDPTFKLASAIYAENPFGYMGITDEASSIYPNTAHHATSSFALGRLLQGESLKSPLLLGDPTNTHKGPTLPLYLRLLEVSSAAISRKPLPHIIAGSQAVLWANAGKLDPAAIEQVLAEFQFGQIMKNNRTIRTVIKKTFSDVVKQNYQTEAEFIDKFFDQFSVNIAVITGIRGQWHTTIKKGLKIAFLQFYHSQKDLYNSDKLNNIDLSVAFKDFFERLVGMNSLSFTTPEPSFQHNPLLVPVILELDLDHLFHDSKNFAPCVISPRHPERIIPLFSIPTGIPYIKKVTLINYSPFYQGNQKIEKMCDKYGIRVSATTPPNSISTSYGAINDISVSQVITTTVGSAEERIKTQQRDHIPICMRRYSKNFDDGGYDILDLQEMSWQAWEPHIAAKRVALLIGDEPTFRPRTLPRIFKTHRIFQLFGTVPLEKLAKQITGTNMSTYTLQKIISNSDQLKVGGVFSS